MESDLRWFFLREFTRQLILNSISDEERKLILEEQEKEREKYTPRAPQQINMVASPRTKAMSSASIERRPIPVIKPLPGHMDLGKLNLFVADPRVNQIECYGPKKEILVKVRNQTQKTRTELDKEEIEKIISSFSEKTRIPLIKGVFRAALGNLLLTAVISDFVDTRFTIQKRAPFEKLS
ncbi:hypothetical protein CO038_01625 [Candidatus Pacearchaeota archaeon CG_4_9_14_0_2_um_filter_39_13]|nr:hypothetical protein [Candidatus Pacearchaeota archaeon]OIO42457.1 MAG: hypothetical protein AUJ64_04065 [Candidatus Pacearchaeota archaeon CG1_02_39_14]PJC44830.1 MAG: hypothetical protein CO038_01625 [Candidatus Pacearchaeota archaeon CG_4_9_14_0_2_um_filter_39_13]